MNSWKVGEPYLETRRGHYWECAVLKRLPDGNKDVFAMAHGETRNQSEERALIIADCLWRQSVKPGFNP